jgi:hypothetical protein
MLNVTILHTHPFFESVIIYISLFIPAKVLLSRSRLLTTLHNGVSEWGWTCNALHNSNTAQIKHESNTSKGDRYTLNFLYGK